MRGLSLALAINIAVAFGIPNNKHHAYPATPIAHVNNGTYTGTYSPEYHQDFFLGLPYALPPVADLRFRNPFIIERLMVQLSSSDGVFARVCRLWSFADGV